MKITKRLYIGLWKNVNIPTDDSVKVTIRRYFKDKVYIVWKTLKPQS